jgi:hypothetical protein
MFMNNCELTLSSRRPNKINEMFKQPVLETQKLLIEFAMEEMDLEEL